MSKNSLLNEVLIKCKSDNNEEREEGFTDLRFLIERYTQNRYDRSSEEEYKLLFYNLKLLDVRLTEEEFEYIKNFLYYSILNVKDNTSILIAKCIKVTYDYSSIEAICKLIEYYAQVDDITTDVLILAINNQFDDGSHFKNERIVSVYKHILKNGGKYSKERINYIFNFYKENYDNSFSW